MLRIVQSLVANENGTISVDWIFLSAGVVAIALSASSLVISGTDISAEDQETTVAEYSFGG